MRNVRLWFRKDDESRFISHLDLNRVVSRTVKMSRLPVWYTQGFNPHPFIVFPLSLSLGFRSPRECVDVRLESDINSKDAVTALNLCVPKGLEFFDITEPVMKAREISYAKFNIKISSDDISSVEIKNKIGELLSKDNIIVSKKSKSGIKDIDIKPYITNCSVNIENENVFLSLIFPAGSTININPLLFINSLEKYANTQIFYDITRICLMNKDMNIFE